MAWGKAGRPTWKECEGYGRGPHLMKYDTDFPKHWCTLKNGERVFYAGSLCFDCRNAYSRELRRMNNRLAGRANRPQDVPWKKFRRRQDNTWVRGRNARHTQIDSKPFFDWLDPWLELRGLSIEKVCSDVKITSRTVRRWRTQGHMQYHSAEKFFVYAGMPELGRALYPKERKEHRKRAA